jgi:hypothetical protein
MTAPRLVSDRPLRELRGVAERITYQNPENGFTVARLAPERPESEAERRGSAQAAVAPVPADAWTRLSAGDGSQGPRRYDGAWLPLAGDGPPGSGRRLLALRCVSDSRELAYSRIFPPTTGETVRSPACS